MLDRLGDPLLRAFGSLETLPSAWRELLDGLNQTLAESAQERDRLLVAHDRASTELAELLVEVEALRRARAAAESTNLVRGEILATLSRTMRTPADTILGLTALLRGGALQPTQRAYVDAVQGAGEALRSILNEVSDYSRLESGTLPLEPIPFDLRLMIEDMAGTLTALAEAKGLTLRMAWRPDTPRRVLADPGRIRQVLTALIRDGLNRIERGEVVLEVGRGTMRAPSGGVRFTVEDSGPGIAPDLLPMLFEPFTRGDAYPGRDGSLALPIAHHLARLLGGELSAAGVEGAGVRFSLSLPLPVVDGSEAVPLPAEEELAPPQPTLGLMVVDADPDQRAGWAQVADAAGFQAVGVGHREEAIEELRKRARERRPVAMVLFSDHDADGYDAIARRIHSEPELGQPALIMLPAVGNPGDARRLREAGFRGYLVKPVAPADLREMLEALRRMPSGVWTGTILTRHALAEARRGGGVRDEELEATLGALTNSE
ncbi:MAG TPA: hybrid sensor histidine kinase/response regulator [Gemmatimonadales bacterium]|nr:hybrid sensor histidine kinase/response regulator [Gemmatimonadales bacterium]